MEVSDFFLKVLGRLDREDEIITNLSEKNYRLTPEQIIADLVCFADEMYDGRTVQDGKSLKINFGNGQSFLIMVNEL